MKRRGTEQLKQLRVLMTADAVGGVWQYALTLIREFRRFPVQVDLAVMGPAPDTAQKTELSAFGNARFHGFPGRLEWMDHPWQDVDRAGEWLLALKEELRPDLIHLNNYCHGNLQWSRPTILVGHSCVFSWWQAVEGCAPPDRYGEYYRRVAAGLEKADRVVAPSLTMLGNLHRVYGIKKNGVVIPNALPAPEGADGPSWKQKRIVSIGRCWDKGKNIMLLESVAEDLPWPVTVAGDNLEPGSGRSAVKGNIRYTGRLDRSGILALLREAWIYVHPARYEPFGLAVLEAAREGCVLVLGNIDSLRENWEGAAVFVSPDNPAELREKLRLLAESPSLLYSYGARARQRAMEFSSSRMAGTYWDIYKTLVTNR